MTPSSLEFIPPRDFPYGQLLVKGGVEIHLIPIDPVACTLKVE